MRKAILVVCGCFGLSFTIYGMARLTQDLCMMSATHIQMVEVSEEKKPLYAEDLQRFAVFLNQCPAGSIQSVTIMGTKKGKHPLLIVKIRKANGRISDSTFELVDLDVRQSANGVVESVRAMPVLVGKAP